MVISDLRKKEGPDGDIGFKEKNLRMEISALDQLWIQKTTGTKQYANARDGQARMRFPSRIQSMPCNFSPADGRGS
jgi:hypothetical protein